MTDSNVVRRQAIVMNSGAVAVVLASLGLMVLHGDQPLLVQPGENDRFAGSLRLSQHLTVNQVPDWLALPDRSSAPYGNGAGVDAGKSRLSFRSLLPAHAIERHYRSLLSANGFEMAVIRPANSHLGLAVIIDAIDLASGRLSQIVIRDVRAVRAVEIAYLERQPVTVGLDL